MQNSLAVIENFELIEIEDFQKPKTYRQTLEDKEETAWQKLAGTSLNDSINTWLATLKGSTKKNYTSGINMLNDLGFIDLNLSLQEFSKINQNTVVDDIKKIPGLSEATKQARAACYISFTKFMSRRTEGMIKAATPCREGSLDTTKTFGSIRDEVKSEALNPVEWVRLIDALDNKRDALVVKLMLQGAKRISEVLSLTIDKVDFEKKQAEFKQLKTKGKEKWLTVNLPESIALELKELIGERESGFVFETRRGKSIKYTQIYRAMKKSAKVAKFEKKNIHPHTMRASAITYHRSQGVPDCEITRLTGQSLQMMHRYDKGSQADNASRIALI